MRVDNNASFRVAQTMKVATAEIRSDERRG